MLDFYDQIYSWLTLSLREQFPDIVTSRTETTALSTFPAVSIAQKNSANYTRTRDADPENHVSVMYEINIYTNGETDKEQTAQKIRNYISDLMLSKGFNRTVCEPIDNISNMSIYRIVMRFTGIIGKDNFVYSR